MYNDKFKEDLKFGEMGEDSIINFLLRYYKNTLTYIGKSSIGTGDNKKFDLKFRHNTTNKEITIECKTDKYRDTGNLAIEISCSGKPSGITSTKSDVFVYYYSLFGQDNFYMIKTKELKELIKNNSWLPIKSGGDGMRARLVLMARKDFKQYFKVLTLNNMYTKIKEEPKINTLDELFPMGNTKTLKQEDNRLHQTKMVSDTVYYGDVKVKKYDNPFDEKGWI
jgi:hypothetical protein